LNKVLHNVVVTSLLFNSALTRAGKNITYLTPKSKKKFIRIP
jgi:hypothetical protein